jgi:hypothetical protein
VERQASCSAAPGSVQQPPWFDAPPARALDAPMRRAAALPQAAAAAHRAQQQQPAPALQMDASPAAAPSSMRCQSGKPRPPSPSRAQNEKVKNSPTHAPSNQHREVIFG